MDSIVSLKPEKRKGFSRTDNLLEGIGILFAFNPDNLCRIDRRLIKILLARFLEISRDRLHGRRLLIVFGRANEFVRYKERQERADRYNDDYQSNVLLFHLTTSYLISSFFSGW